MRTLHLVMAIALATAMFVSRPAPAQTGPKTFKDCDECPQMAIVPAGTFMMGSSPVETNREARERALTKEFRKLIYDEFAAYERPQHSVTLKEFAIGQYPVTRGEFAAFVRETVENPSGCNVYNPSTASWGVDPKKSWRDPGFEQTDQHPVVCVSRGDAQLYIEWLNRKTGRSYRLPSEAEWEYAARAGTRTARYWGEGLDRTCDFANIADQSTAGPLRRPAESLVNCRDGYVYTSPVGAFRPNAFGLYDMLGNVAQKIADCFHDDYKGAPSDGSAWTADCRHVVLGFNMGGYVVRGAGFSTRPEFSRSASRRTDDVDKRDNSIGFRLALTPGEIKRPAAPVATDCSEAEVHWKNIDDIKSRELYEAHLARYPNCPFATLARARLQQLQK